MAFKIVSLTVLVVTVAAELHHPLFYHDALRYVVTGEEKNHAVQNSNSFFRVDGSLYNPQFPVEGEESPWNYLIPTVNSVSLIPTTYPEPVPALPLAAPCTDDVSLTYSTHVEPTKAANRVEEIPFGYVPSVAKISVPAGYKIH